jgi:hypothetical protein
MLVGTVKVEDEVLVAMLTGDSVFGLEISDAREEITLSTLLVAEKEPVVMLGVVPARDIVGVVVRPCALLSAVLAPALVLIAGVADDTGVGMGMGMGGAPSGAWYIFRE